MNPHRIRVVCQECARDVWANTRTGLLYSHTRPDSSETCPASAQPATTPTDAGAPPPTAPSLRAEPAPPDPNVETASGTSIHAIPAGLPGHGRRR